MEVLRMRLAAVPVVDKSSSNRWAEIATVVRQTHLVLRVCEIAKADRKKLIPEDATAEIGRVVRAKTSESGVASFEMMAIEIANGPRQSDHVAIPAAEGRRSRTTQLSRKTTCPHNQSAPR